MEVAGAALGTKNPIMIYFLVLDKKMRYQIKDLFSWTVTIWWRNISGSRFP